MGSALDGLISLPAFAPRSPASRVARTIAFAFVFVVALGVRLLYAGPAASACYGVEQDRYRIAHFYHQALVGSPFEDYAPKRIVRDLLAIPGRLVFENHRLVRVELLSLKQFSTDLVECLQKYCADP